MILHKCLESTLSYSDFRKILDFMKYSMSSLIIKSMPINIETFRASLKS